MEVDMNILTEQMMIFFVIMCCGFIGVKINLINKEMLQSISKLIMRLVCPMMVLCIYPTAINGVETGRTALKIMPLCAIMYVLLAGFSFLLATLLGMRGDKRKIFMAQCQFGNLGFFGLPLVKEIFDISGNVAFSFCIIVDSLFIWTEGVILTSGSGEKKRMTAKELIGKMANPVTAGLITGLILMLFRVSPDSIVLRSFDTIGSCSKSLALIYIGGTIATMNLGSLKKAWPTVFVVVLKMVIMPVMACKIMRYLGIDKTILQTLVLVLALPSMANLPVMAENFGSSESEYAAQGVFIITLLSLLTIPLVVFLTH
ncbi:MAG: AEC family transporter [Lachnospiraceae bacterium]